MQSKSHRYKTTLFLFRQNDVNITNSHRYTGRDYLTFVSVCVVMATNISIVHAFGTLFPFILSEFDEGRAKTATVQSVLFGVGLCSGILYNTDIDNCFFPSCIHRLSLILVSNDIDPNFQVSSSLLSQKCPVL